MGDVWDHLQEQVETNTKMNEINGWEFDFSNEILSKQVIRVKMCYLHT
jgi:hypothetical protein